MEHRPRRPPPIALLAFPFDDPAHDTRPAPRVRAVPRETQGTRGGGPRAVIAPSWHLGQSHDTDLTAAIPRPTSGRTARLLGLGPSTALYRSPFAQLLSTTRSRHRPVSPSPTHVPCESSGRRRAPPSGPPHVPRETERTATGPPRPRSGSLRGASENAPPRPTAIPEVVPPVGAGRQSWPSVNRLSLSPFDDPTHDTGPLPVACARSM